MEALHFRVINKRTNAILGYEVISDPETWHYLLKDECTDDEGNIDYESHNGFIENDLMIVFKRDLYINKSDKNGRKIYEGDILRFYSLNWKVEFDERNLAFSMTGLISDSKHSFFNVDSNELEIIGNIYENPELINEAQNG